jgi:hypothetical protein
MSIAAGNKADGPLLRTYIVCGSDDEAVVDSTGQSVNSKFDEPTLEQRCTRATYSAIDAWIAIDRRAAASGLTPKRVRYEKRKALNSLIRELAKVHEYSDQDLNAAMLAIKERRGFKHRLEIAMHELPLAETSLQRVLRYHRSAAGAKPRSL